MVLKPPCCKAVLRLPAGYDESRVQERTLGCFASPRLCNRVVKQPRTGQWAVRFGNTGSHHCRGDRDRGNPSTGRETVHHLDAAPLCFAALRSRAGGAPHIHVRLQGGRRRASGVCGCRRRKAKEMKHKLFLGKLSSLMAENRLLKFCIVVLGVATVFNAVMTFRALTYQRSSSSLQA